MCTIWSHPAMETVSYGEEDTQLQKVLEPDTAQTWVCIQSPGELEKTWTSPSHLQRFWFGRLGMGLPKQEMLLLVHARSPQVPAPLQTGVSIRAGDKECLTPSGSLGCAVFWTNPTDGIPRTLSGSHRHSGVPKMTQKSKRPTTPARCVPV